MAVIRASRDRQADEREHGDDKYAHQQLHRAEHRPTLPTLHFQVHWPVSEPKGVQKNQTGSDPLSQLDSRGLTPTGGSGELGLQRLELAADLGGQVVAELGQELADLAELLAQRRLLDREELLERLGGDVQAVGVEVLRAWDQADRG